MQAFFRIRRQIESKAPEVGTGACAGDGSISVKNAPLSSLLLVFMTAVS
jgi:hypothetical protein